MGLKRFYTGLKRFYTGLKRFYTDLKRFYTDLKRFYTGLKGLKVFEGVRFELTKCSFRFVSIQISIINIKTVSQYSNLFLSLHCLLFLMTIRIGLNNSAPTGTKSDTPVTSTVLTNLMTKFGTVFYIWHCLFQGQCYWH